MKPLQIVIEAPQPVSGLLATPPDAWACYVLAHGAGAGMAHPFMNAVASGLFDRGIATLRYQFLYMEKGAKRPDLPVTAHATVRAAVAEAVRRCPTLPVIGGGKSFGARMTSQAQATSPLPGVKGLAFLGFPLHPAGKPSDKRATHLFDIAIPMLFLQGTRDSLADLPLLRALTEKLGSRVTLNLFEHADHSFHVPVRSGKNDRIVMDEMLDVLAAWIAAQSVRSGQIMIFKPTTTTG